MGNNARCKWLIAAIEKIVDSPECVAKDFSLVGIPSPVDEDMLEAIGRHFSTMWHTVIWYPNCSPMPALLFRGRRRH